MGDISEEVLRYWENLVTDVGEELSIEYDVIDIFKTNKDMQTYILLAVKQYVPSLEDLIIIGALSCSNYLKTRELGRITLIWYCYDIRNELVKKLISLDERNYSYIRDTKEENYNDLTNITNIIELLSSDKNTYEAYNINKLKYLKKTLTKNNDSAKLN